MLFVKVLITIYVLRSITVDVYSFKSLLIETLFVLSFMSNRTNGHKHFFFRTVIVIYSYALTCRFGNMSFGQCKRFSSNATLFVLRVLKLTVQINVLKTSARSCTYTWCVILSMSSFKRNSMF